MNLLDLHQQAKIKPFKVCLLSQQKQAMNSKQKDVETSFLHPTIDSKICSEETANFLKRNTTGHNVICGTEKPVFGLKQVPNNWQEKWLHFPSAKVSNDVKLTTVLYSEAEETKILVPTFFAIQRMYDQNFCIDYIHFLQKLLSTWNEPAAVNL